MDPKPYANEPPIPEPSWALQPRDEDGTFAPIEYDILGHQVIWSNADDLV